MLCWESAASATRTIYSEVTRTIHSENLPVLGSCDRPVVECHGTAGARNKGQFSGSDDGFLLNAISTGTWKSGGGRSNCSGNDICSINNHLQEDFQQIGSGCR